MRRRRSPAEADPPGPEASLEIAARFLGTRPRSRWEVERRLRRGRATEAIVERTLDHLIRLGLIDDLAFARWWVDQRDRHAPRGRRLVEAELRQHGVEGDVIEQLRDELAAFESRSQRSEEDMEHSQPAGDTPATERERAKVALAQHLRGRPLPEDPRALQRLGMFLMRRGFDPDTVRSTLREAGSSDANSDD